MERRSFIKGSATAALSATAAMASFPAAASAPADRAAWEAAIARYKRAKAADTAYSVNTFDPAYEAERAFEQSRGLFHRLPNGQWSQNYFERRRVFEQAHGTAYRVPEEVHARYEALGEATNDAEEKAMDTPAPDLAALRWKLDRLIDANPEKGDGTSAWSAAYVAQTMEDIARLLPPGR